MPTLQLTQMGAELEIFNFGNNVSIGNSHVYNTIVEGRG